MNSEVTLTNYSTHPSSKGQVRLLFKRNDPYHAVLYDEDDAPRYWLSTSNGLSKVKIRDGAQRTVVEVNRRMLLSDTFTLADRNEGKAVRVADVLKQAPTTSDSQLSMVLHTEQGTYYWRKRRAHHWVLHDGSMHAPVAWTETVPGTPPTWELVVESEASCVLDYILASLFYLKASPDCTEAGSAWDNVNSHSASLVTL
ncbi:hypothetical protein D9756_008869 [Leucocoprinus leucothites]|uniref:Uncharacterized protein n=1 Tax=Leucocoprinus leucothites TaxID=201217 RepID=A0A8H5FUJ6_9AGAR|nr:hypothetical protein D9756_008869 [Leucoagaricus leucothites]